MILRTRPRDVEETLLILINSDDEVVSAAAIDLVGRLELRSLVDDLEHVLAHRDVRDWHVFEAASWTLAGLRLQASKRRALWLEPLPSVEIASRLRSIPLFASVATDELFRIARTGRQVRLDRGHTLYEAGALPSHVHLLLDGQVRATAPGGEARDVQHPAPLGLEEVLEERPHPETVRATETSVALQLTVEEARGLLADNTDLVQGLFRWMLDHPAFGTGRLVVRGTGAAAGDGAAPRLEPATPAAGAASAALRPIDVVLALRRIPLFARSSVEARLALAAIAREERLEPNGILLHASDAPAIRLVIDGELEAATPTGETVAIAPGDAIGVLETLRGRADRRQHPRDGGRARPAHQPRGLLRPARPARRPAAVAVRDAVRRPPRRVGPRRRRHVTAGGGAGSGVTPAAAGGRRDRGGARRRREPRLGARAVPPSARLPRRAARHHHAAGPERHVRRQRERDRAGADHRPVARAGPAGGRRSIARRGRSAIRAAPCGSRWRDRAPTSSASRSARARSRSTGRRSIAISPRKASRRSSIAAGRTGRLGQRARESYAKAAKTLIAVTDAAGHLAPPARAGASAALVASGYAAEIVPLVDPYTVGVGATVPVRALVGGRPLAGWTIRAGGTIGTSTTAIPTQVLTTDRDGRADVRLTHDGHWFVAFVHMVDAPPGGSVDYVSRWATLTFGVLPADAR